MLRRKPAEDEPDGQPKRLSKYMDKLLSTQAIYIKLAQEKQLSTDIHNMGTKEVNYEDYPITSYVLFSHPDGPKDKMSCRRTGPYQVVNHIGNQYTIENLIKGKHTNNYDPARTIPKDVAIADMREFVVEAILDHRGDRNRSSQMEFLVKWQGYEIKYDSWEPYENLRDTDQLIAYLKANRMRSLVPTKHK
jgi:hypothetical protein